MQLYFKKLKETFPLTALLIFSMIFTLNLSAGTKEVSATVTENNPFGLAGPSAPDDPDKIGLLETHYVREGISWYKLETSDNVYDFSALDEAGWLEQLNLELIVRLKLGNDFSTTNHSWAVKCNPSLCTPGAVDCPMERVDCPPKDLAANWTGWSQETGYSPLLTDFIERTLAEIHARGKDIEYFVIGNEVNTLSFWLGTAEDYLKTRSTIYNAVKRFNAANDKNYKVVDSGIASTIWSNAIAYEAFCRGDVSYALDFANRAADHILERDITASDFAWLDCSDIGGRDYKIMKAMFQKDPNLNEPTFDVMAYHFYEPWDVQEEVINWIRQEMVNNGYEPKPIINTEGGYRDLLHLYSDTPTLEQDVADDIPKLHAVAFANGVNGWLWLPFTERGPEYDTYGYEWKGLVREDQTVLLAYKSYQTMVKKIKNYTAIDKLSGLPISNIYKISFADKNPVYLVWNEQKQTVDLSSILSGNILETSFDGSVQYPSPSQIALSKSPIYLEEVVSPVSIDKTVDKISANPGETLIYTLNFSNITENVIDIKIDDPIPSGTTFSRVISGSATFDEATNKISSNISVPGKTGGSIVFEVRINN